MASGALSELVELNLVRARFAGATSIELSAIAPRSLQATPVGRPGTDGLWRPGTGACLSAAELHELRQASSTPQGVPSVLRDDGELQDESGLAVPGRAGSASVQGRACETREARAARARGRARARAGNASGDPCVERKRDVVDLEILSSKGSEPAWRTRSFRTRAEQDEVSKGLWAFEQRAGLCASSFHVLTKKQMLEVLASMPVKLSTLMQLSASSSFKGSSSSPSGGGGSWCASPGPPRNVEAMSKEELVLLFEEVNRMYGVLDAKAQEREAEELRALRSADSDDDALDADAAEALAAELKLSQERRAPSKLVFRTKPFSASSFAITPRQTRELRTCIFDYCS